MPISSALKVRNKSIRATYATITGGTVHCRKNIAVTPFTPITGLNGKPFVDVVTNETYYDYYVDPTGNPLPAGLSLNSRTGQVTGTPTVSTVVSATSFGIDCKFAVRDSRNKRAYKESTVTFVITEPLAATVPTDKKIVGIVNQVVVDKSIFATITGGRPPYVYTVTQGVLPADVEIDQTTGKLTGTPSETKRTFTDPSQTDVLPITSAVLIEAQDFYGDVVTSTFDFDVIDSVIAIPRMDTLDITKNFVIKGVIPLAISYQSFNSVVSGTPPYTYFISTKQKDPLPAGITLNATTGLFSGTYGSTSEYTGTIQISVKDSTNAIAAKIAKVDINAYLPFVVVVTNKVGTTDKTTYDSIELKAIDVKALKGQYGAPPYTFSVTSCKYTSKTNVITTTSTLPTGVTLTAIDGTVKTTTGLPTGTYELTYRVVDSAGTVAANVPVITLAVSDAVAANSLVTVKNYEMYVGTSPSAFSVGFDVLGAELGIPPYTFKVEPALPSGMLMTTLPTKCFINGIPNEPVDKAYVFSVKDSTGMQAKYTETLNFKIVAHLTSSANVTDIDGYIDTLVEPVDIFDSITGGYPPYTVTQLTGSLRPELSIVAMGFVYNDTNTGKDVTVDIPKIWGNALITGSGTGTPILGINNTYGYASQDTYTFRVTDSRGEVSPNIATLNYNIYRPIRGVATRIPPVVTGIAESTSVSFVPITPIDGVPPYTINVTKTITDRSKKPPVKVTYPTLGLKTVQPNKIAGTPNAGYSGYLYYYLTDSTGGRTNNIPVRFEITPKISAVKYTKPIEVMYVKGYPKFEITDRTGTGDPVVTLVDNFKYPFFKSVIGGSTPYVYYETDSTGKSVATSQIPPGWSIDSFGNLATIGGDHWSLFPTKILYCAVADANLVKAADVSGIQITLNDAFTTELVDNTSENASSVTSFNSTISNTLVTKQTGDNFTSFIPVRGKNGSGRYGYMFDLTTVSPTPVLNYLQINGTTGEIKLKPLPNGTPVTKFTDIVDLKIGIKVTDNFTNESIVVSGATRIVTVNPMTVTAINATVNFDKDTTHNNDPIFTVAGGSGTYQFDSIDPPMPTNPLAFTSTGGLTGAANVIIPETRFKVTFKDIVYGTKVFGYVTFSVTSGFIVVPVASSGPVAVTGLGKPALINLNTIKTISQLTSTQLLNNPVKIRIDIDTNVSSVNTTIPALTVSIPTGLHPDTTIKLITKTGSIVGAGGKGGVPSTNPVTANGGGGGPALKLDTGSIVVDVECLPGTFIGGGGGGGGASGASWRYYKGPIVRMYATEDYTNGSVQVYNGSNWVAIGQISNNPEYMRMTYVLDTTYGDLNYINSGPTGRNTSLDYSIPTPMPSPIPSGTQKITYQAYTKMLWITFKNLPLPNARQTDKPYYASTYFTSGQGFGGNGYGYNGAMVATAGYNGAKGAPANLLGNSDPRGTAAYLITFTDPSTINTSKLLLNGVGSAANPTVTYLKSLGITNSANGSVWVKDSLLYSAGTSASAGEGITPGLGGLNIDETTITDRYNWLPYYGAGGGGGAGGVGGDGGSAASAPPSDAPVLSALPLGGVGGAPGPAIVTATTTPLPNLITPSLVHGDVL
jgi:hypothetical protein